MPLVEARAAAHIAAVSDQQRYAIERLERRVEVLENLVPLYRIAAFLALAVIALAVAYAYNRKVTAETS